jgi:dihydropteroate synthase
MSSVLRSRFSIPLPDGQTLELGQRTLVMAIVNVTPDSFSDGGARFDPNTAVSDALRFVADGADLIDIGGESTRPGAPPVDADEEWRRIAPVLEGLRGRVSVPVSVDTSKASVAERALALGATIINDVSGLSREPALAGVAARTGAAVVLMHSRGASADMYAAATYADVVEDVRAELTDRDRAARAAGIAPERIILDPGLGFAKRAEHTWAILAGLPALASLGRPLLSGPSRKSFLQTAIGDRPPRERVFATAAAITASVLFGAHIVRVHDVAEMVDVVRAADELEAARRSLGPEC